MNHGPLPSFLCHPVAKRIVALGLLWPAIVWADCVDGVRQPSAAELDFHGRAIAALVSALPAAPAGVKLTGGQVDPARMPSIGVLCRDQKVGDFALEASRTYALEYSAEEFRRRRAERTALSDQLHALTVLPPDLKAQRDALQQQASAGYTATDAARKAGDMAGAKAREAEAHAFSKQAREVQQRHEDAMKGRATEIRARHDAIDLEGQKAAVRVAINVVRLPAANPALPAAAYGAPSPGKSAALKVQNVVWSVGGADTPLRQALAAAIDRNRLEGLVGKPLPPAAQSAALAAGAAPVALAAQAPAEPVPAAGGPAQALAGAAMPVSAAPAGADGGKRAAEAVNQLRGLFGR